MQPSPINHTIVYSDLWPWSPKSLLCYSLLPGGTYDMLLLLMLLLLRWLIVKFSELAPSTLEACTVSTAVGSRLMVMPNQQSSEKSDISKPLRSTRVNTISVVRLYARVGKVGFQQGFVWLNVWEKRARGWQNPKWYLVYTLYLVCIIRIRSQNIKKNAAPIL